MQRHEPCLSHPTQPKYPPVLGSDSTTHGHVSIALPPSQPKMLSPLSPDPDLSRWQPASWFSACLRLQPLFDGATALYACTSLVIAKALFPSLPLVKDTLKRKLLTACDFPETDLALDMVMRCSICTGTMMGILTKKQDWNMMIRPNLDVEVDVDDGEVPRDYDHEPHQWDKTTIFYSRMCFW